MTDKLHEFQMNKLKRLTNEKSNKEHGSGFR